MLARLSIKALSRHEIVALFIVLFVVLVHLLSVIHKTKVQASESALTKITNVPVISQSPLILSDKNLQSFSLFFDIEPQAAVEEQTIETEQGDLVLVNMEAKLVAVVMLGDQLTTRIAYQEDNKTLYKNIKLNEELYGYTLTKIELDKVSFTNETDTFTLHMFKLQQPVES